MPAQSCIQDFRREPLRQVLSGKQGLQILRLGEKLGKSLIPRGILEKDPSDGS